MQVYLRSPATHRIQFTQLFYFAIRVHYLYGPAYCILFKLVYYYGVRTLALSSCSLALEELLEALFLDGLPLAHCCGSARPAARPAAGLSLRLGLARPATAARLGSSCDSRKRLGSARPAYQRGFGAPRLDEAARLGFALPARLRHGLSRVRRWCRLVDAGLESPRP